MTDWLIKFSLRNRLLVLALTGILIAVGIASMRRLTIDAVPDITTVQVQVLTAAPALGPLEIEQSVTYAVETSLSGLPDVEELRSISRYGISSVTVVFKEGTSLWFARQLVQERLSDAKERIPAGAGTPEMAPPSTGLGEIYHFVLEGPGYSPMELRSILDWQVAYRLRQVPGVGEVNPWGGYAKQFQVLVDPAKLRAYGISLGEVFEAVEKGNGLAGSAYIEKRQEQILIRGEGLISSLRDLASVVVEAREGGTPILVRDLAKVVEGGMPRRGAATQDGKGEAVIAIVQMLAGENSRLVTERVKAAVATDPARPSRPAFASIPITTARNWSIERSEP
jgi:cobalt-zinc-cadmium resistance protein CzcA